MARNPIAGLLALLATSAAIALGAVATSPPAEACGGFFSRRAIEADRRPSLAYEQTLIVFDEKKRREHFIREVVFRRTGEPFGFVVPTPTRPEVAKLRASPFSKLRADFPFRSSKEGLGLLSIGSVGHGRLGGKGVTVLEVVRVGSFTAFVLKATDREGLAVWLRDNGLTASSEAEPWLGHYVAQGFHFVAMRYEAPPRPPAAADAEAEADEASTTAETIRISFDTPLPFYPYREPDPPAGAVPDPRMLEVWLVTGAALTPISARTRGGATTWVRPLVEGDPFPGNQRERLAAALGPDASVLPPGELAVQRFVDQKRSRLGFGDVVFVPRAPAPNDAAVRASLRAFVSSLDPSLPPAKVAP